jgi:hypothetical protein
MMDATAQLVENGNVLCSVKEEGERLFILSEEKIQTYSK